MRRVMSDGVFAALISVSLMSSFLSSTHQYACASFEGNEENCGDHGKEQLIESSLDHGDSLGSRNPTSSIRCSAYTADTVKISI